MAVRGRGGVTLGDEARRASPALLPLLRELGDLKRVRSACRPGSIAERLFCAGWAALAAGSEASAVARAMTCAGLAAARLGDLDAATLAAVGIPSPAVRAIQAKAIGEVGASVDAGLLSWLTQEAPALPHATPPDFVARLQRQPRAGATCPGRGRLMLEPAENHAEHCAIVAIAGVLLAPVWGADPAEVFVAGLAHHLHNAWLPDAGFAGEVLLGDWLEPAMVQATTMALAELEPGLRALVMAARRVLPDASTPGGRVFHAADTIDRVLQVEHHLRAAGTSMGYVQRQMALVHDGPAKPFQDSLLAWLDLAA